MFWLGILTMIFINGILVLILNTFNVDEDIKDTIFGFWLLPFVAIAFYFREKRLKKKEEEKLQKFINGG